METTEQILTRQCAALNFSNGKVQYFSISTQWDEADTIDEAIHNIINADIKCEGKPVLDFLVDKHNKMHWVDHGDVITKEQSDRLYEIAKDINFIRELL